VDPRPNVPSVRGNDFHESELRVAGNRLQGRVVSCTGEAISITYQNILTVVRQ